ncbi:MAG: Maf family protein [Pseudobdellovibrionaceae bacterium]
MTKRPIVLASQSPYRKELLKKLDLSFTQEKPLVDEDALKQQNSKLSPRNLCQLLGRVKGLKVHELRKAPSQITISGDQLVSFQGQILGKTADRETAHQQLRILSGQTHELLTSIYVFSFDDVYEILNVTKLTMYNLTSEQIERYLDLDAPFDCAGTYKIEQHGISLFSEIVTEDFTAIQGIPLLGVHSILKKLL